MNQIEKYFNAEKFESVLFVLVGIAALAIACYCLMKMKQPFYNGLSYPLIAVGLIQIVVGITVFVRSPKDIARMKQIIHNDVSKIQTEEIPRMEVVMKNFTIYRWTEIILLLIGVFIFLYMAPMSVLKGLILGLLIQSSFMLLLDYFAESRGEMYLAYLLSIQ